MNNLSEEEEKHLRKLVKDSKVQAKTESHIFMTEFKRIPAKMA